MPAPKRARAIVAALVSWGICSPAMPAIDLTPLWDFSRPAVTEQRFRDLLPAASAEDAAILRTQIARTFGLRRDFATARRLLDEMEPALAGLGPEPRVRLAMSCGSKENR